MGPTAPFGLRSAQTLPPSPNGEPERGCSTWVYGATPPSSFLASSNALAASSDALVT